MFAPLAELPPVGQTPPPSHTPDHESPSPVDHLSGGELPGSEFVLPGAKDADLDKTLPKDTLHGYVPLTPITTTSPPPQGPRLRFPSLMSQHQRWQRYYPSLNSMFAPPLEPGNVLLSSPTRLLMPAPSSPLYRPPSLLKEPRMDGVELPYIPIRSSPPPALSPGKKSPTIPGPLVGRTLSNERVPPRRSASRFHELRTLVLPHETFSQFLTIAQSETLMNEETYGLLLGKEVWLGGMSPPLPVVNSTPGGSPWRNATIGAAGERTDLAVTTLLIPEQRGANRMSLMDEEELLWGHMQERDLMLVGWIHTHPSQSCFMSSADLHIHSKLQRMLPEAIAVICAPNSVPNLGIFRLTDPPGLQTVLGCTRKEAFHSHPDLPIYTDADKGHFYMRDSPLEIIDLRS